MMKSRKNELIIKNKIIIFILVCFRECLLYILEKKFLKIVEYINFEDNSKVIKSANILNYIESIKKNILSSLLVRRKKCLL